MSKLREIEKTMIQHDDPVVSVPDLADEIGRSDTHVRDQLRLLERDGVVRSKDVGARATAWWHTARVEPPLPSDFVFDDGLDLEEALGTDTPTQDALEDARRDAIDDLRESEQRGEGSPQRPHSAESEGAAERGSFSREEARERVQHLDLPGSGPTLDARRELVVDVAELLAGSARRVPPARIKELIDPEAVGYQTVESAWSHVVYEALQTCPEFDLPGGQGSHGWEWAPEEGQDDE